jgi:hypothetical protein
MRQLRLVRDNDTKTIIKYKNKKKEVKSMDWLRQFKEEYKEWITFDETPVQKKKPRKLGNRIIPSNPTLYLEGKVIQNPFELKKMGYEPSKSCWENFYQSRLSVVKKKVKQTKKVFKKVA